ncbi:MAG: hypothetical protein EXS09_16160 [Gemmataceae bacterium]|nr:hypothetical protein [Gemmataceae bacterium]
MKTSGRPSASTPSSQGLTDSGAVESACKTVVVQRLKLAGMRWREPGSDSANQVDARTVLQAEVMDCHETQPKSWIICANKKRFLRARPRCGRNFTPVSQSPASCLAVPDSADWPRRTPCRAD